MGITLQTGLRAALGLASCSLETPLRPHLVRWCGPCRSQRPPRPSACPAGSSEAAALVSGDHGGRAVCGWARGERGRGRFVPACWPRRGGACGACGACGAAALGERLPPRRLELGPHVTAPPGSYFCDFSPVCRVSDLRGETVRSCARARWPGGAAGAGPGARRCGEAPPRGRTLPRRLPGTDPATLWLLIKAAAVYCPVYSRVGEKLP